MLWTVKEVFSHLNGLAFVGRNSIDAMSIVLLVNEIASALDHRANSACEEKQIPDN